MHFCWLWVTQNKHQQTSVKYVISGKTYILSKDMQD